MGLIDDGSGSVTILEAYRALIAADFHPERTVEFHWYSAEVNFRHLLPLVHNLFNVFRKVDFLVPRQSLAITLLVK